MTYCSQGINYIATVKVHKYVFSISLKMALDLFVMDGCLLVTAVGYSYAFVDTHVLETKQSTVLARLH